MMGATDPHHTVHHSESRAEEERDREEDSGDTDLQQPHQQI
jgi:hypothetical protein